jgi:hypothetical protein
VPDQGDEHEHAEDDQRGSDDPAHNCVDALGKFLSKQDRRCPDHEDDQRMPERVDRPERNRCATFVLRAGDVGDRREMVPVDAVAESEQEGGGEDTQAEGLHTDHVGTPPHG